MNRFIFLASLILIVFQSCGQGKIIKLKESGGEKIIYSASKKYGYSLEILKHIAGQYIQYAVRLNGNGEVMYVYKAPVTSDVKPIESSQYLVSDTTDTLHGAEFFGREILGYYGSEAMNFISNNNFRGKSFPYLDEEKEIFVEIAKLMKERNQVFIPFDSTRNLFWFKYDTR
jgi:hypothetical protein